MAEDKLLTVTEVAERLRVHGESVRRWIRQGKMAGSMMGGDRGGYRVAESEVERFIQANRPAPAQR